MVTSMARMALDTALMEVDMTDTADTAPVTEDMMGTTNS